MGFDILLNAIVFFIYGIVFMISVIFTVSLETYSKINEKLNLEIFSSKVIIGILEKDIDWLDNWLVRHNKIVGPLLIILSLIDLAFWLETIKLFAVK
jgi:hypothetical protein